MDLRCRWCDKELAPSPGRRSQPRFCSDAHRQRYRRANNAAATADIVQRLEPYVAEAGVFIFRELVDHLAGKVNESV